MGQFEPRAGECLGKSLRVLEEASRNLLVVRVEAQRQVGRQHLRLLLLRRVMREGDDILGILGHPLVRTGRRLLQHPFEFEQVLEEVVAPLRRRLRHR